MPAELTSQPAQPAREAEPAMVSGEIRCALTGKILSPDEAYWAPPVITARELVATVVRTLLTAPGNLGQILLGELPNVPYAPEARPQLAARRSPEQLKLIALLLLLAALLVIPIVMMVS
ncbi:MAG TPA: hypothetical protein PKD53_10910 [Chloroflexaceae bacterium]|nr:hypothetical protein [Chloroflexaceae bacterium]